MKEEGSLELPLKACERGQRGGVGIGRAMVVVPGGSVGTEALALLMWQLWENSRLWGQVVQSWESHGVGCQQGTVAG